jgi:hypothetical protein
MSIEQACSTYPTQQTTHKANGMDRDGMNSVAAQKAREKLKAMPLRRLLSVL